MRLHNAFGDGKAQARAQYVVARTAPAVELVENLRLLFFLNAFAPVRYAEDDLSAHDLRRNRHGRARRRVVHGVFQKLLQHLLDEFEVDVGSRQCLWYLQLDGASLQRFVLLLHRRPNDIRDGMRRSLRVQFRGLDPRHLEHFHHQPVQAVRLLISNGQQFLFLGIVPLGKQVRDRAFDGRERRLQVVRQRVQQRGFQRFALPRDFDFAGLLERSRPLDADRHEVCQRVESGR